MRKNLRPRMSAFSSERQAEGDRVLDEHGRDIEDHVAERVPEIGIAPKRAQVVEAVEVMAALRVEVPVGEGDGETEERREDHHGAGEQERRQHEQALLSDLAAVQHLGDAERDAPGEEGVEGRTPVGEADRDEARRVGDLQCRDDNEERRSDTEDPLAERHPLGEHLFVRCFKSPAAHSALSVFTIRRFKSNEPGTRPRRVKRADGH